MEDGSSSISVSSSPSLRNEDGFKISPAVQNLMAIFPDYSARELAMILDMKQNSMEETAHVIAIGDSQAELVARAKKYKKNHGEGGSHGQLTLKDGDEGPRRCPNSASHWLIFVRGLFMKCRAMKRRIRGGGHPHHIRWTCTALPSSWSSVSLRG